MSVPAINSSKIENAVARLEQNLPIRQRQTRLTQSLRHFHQWILRYFLERGVAPRACDFTDVKDWQGGIERLAAEHIVVVSDTGDITGAYPFTSEAREFRVITSYGSVNAMCAFDALAVSSMFAMPTRIESSCHLSEQDIIIEQERDDIRVLEPTETVFAAINWAAAAGAGICSETLCTEMIFIAGEERAESWRNADGNNRELFDLPEAQALIAAVFMPLMQ